MLEAKSYRGQSIQFFLDDLKSAASTHSYHEKKNRTKMVVNSYIAIITSSKYDAKRTSLKTTPVNEVAYSVVYATILPFVTIYLENLIKEKVWEKITPKFEIYKTHPVLIKQIPIVSIRDYLSKHKSLPNFDRNTLSIARRELDRFASKLINSTIDSNHPDLRLKEFDDAENIEYCDDTVKNKVKYAVERELSCYEHLIDEFLNIAIDSCELYNAYYFNDLTSIELKHLSNCLSEMGKVIALISCHAPEFQNIMANEEKTGIKKTSSLENVINFICRGGSNTNLSEQKIDIEKQINEIREEIAGIEAKRKPQD